MAETNRTGDSGNIGSKLHMDNHPSKQPPNTHRFALNAVNKTLDGNYDDLSNESSNTGKDTLPGMSIGEEKMLNGEIAVLTATEDGSASHIGILLSTGQFIDVVDFTDLNFSVKHQAQVIFRVLKGNQRSIYWVDAYNNARQFNFDNVSAYYTVAYRAYIDGGSVGSFVGDKWEIGTFDLFPTSKGLPHIAIVKELDYGNIAAGSYNFAICFVDENLNATAWLDTYRTVNIYNDPRTQPFNKIRGSRNTDTLAQSFGLTNKSIQLTIGNLVVSGFPFYRVAIIQANTGKGTVNRVLVTEPISTNNSIFTYSGADETYTETPLADILIDKTVINKPSHIEQIENRLVLGGSKGSKYNWCEFQHYASKIKTDVSLFNTIVNDANSDGNPKNPNSSFMFSGYMPGQPISLGITYLMDDFTLSPVFHIPGKNVVNTTSKMLYHETTQGNYDNIHDCTGGNYWGLDESGIPLTGEPIRHHRLPYRKDLNEKVVNRSSVSHTVTKYKLTYKVGLVGGASFPATGTNLSYGVKYQLANNPTFTEFFDVISQADLGVEKTAYEGIEIPAFISGTDYLILDTTYLSGLVGPTFVFTFNTIASTSVTTVDEQLDTNLFCVELFNVEQPSANVIGCYFVRQQIQEEDKMVIDNAIMGPLITYNQYSSFGHFVPEVFNSAKDAHASYFFNPEYQFQHKQRTITGAKIQGIYKQDSIDLSKKAPFLTIFPRELGLVVEDVQPGTTFNPDINKKKDKDGDGFDLQVGWNNRNFGYSVYTGSPLPTPTETMYLPSCGSKISSGRTYYNTSCDNKIGILRFNSAIDVDHLFTTNPIPAGTDTTWPESSETLTTDNYQLPYVSLENDNPDIYLDFMTRPYYKEHGYPFFFDPASGYLNGTASPNGVILRNGDVTIGAVSPVSTVYYETQFGDRAKKDKTWQIIAGAVLVVVGIVASVFTAGTSLAAVIAGIGLLAISYGVSLAVSGIKFEAMKNMIDNDYPNGLQNTIKDYRTTYSVNFSRSDDTFKWYSGMISDIWVESYTNVALRSGLTAGTSDFFPTPSNGNFDQSGFEAYLTDKFTVIDPERQQGRLYKGYPGAEFYDMNLDYLRQNHEKIYYHLPITYDCCSSPNDDKNGDTIYYSEQSYQQENIDQYRVFLPNNYRTIEGEYGPITNLFRMGSSLFLHTTHRLWVLPQNLQERVTNEIVSFIGTGEFFSVPPRPVGPGSSHKWATTKVSESTAFFVSESTTSFYKLTDGACQPVTEGVINWFDNNTRSTLEQEFKTFTGENYPLINAATARNGIGIHSVYDPVTKRILVTKKDYAIIASGVYYTSAVDQTFLHLALTNNKVIFDPTTDKWYRVTFSLGTYSRAEIFLDNGIYFENKSWTLSYSIEGNGWVGYHSYLPGKYLSSQFDLFSMIPDNLQVYKHNTPGEFLKFYDVYANKYIVEYVSTSNSLRTWDSIGYICDARVFDATSGEYLDKKSITFNKMIAYNSRQSTGEQTVVVKKDNTSTFLSEEVTDLSGVVQVVRKGRVWWINNLKDYVNDYTLPIFSKEWNLIRNDYFIDKVPTSVIDFNKDWFELEPLKERYLIIRLEFNTFDAPCTTNLTVQQSFEDQQEAER